MQLLIITTKTYIKIWTCGKGASCPNYKVLLDWLVSPCDLVLPLSPFVEVSQYFGISLALLDHLVKKVLIFLSQEEEGEGCQQGARPSLLFSHQTRKHCSPLKETRSLPCKFVPDAAVRQEPRKNQAPSLALQCQSISGKGTGLTGENF